MGLVKDLFESKFENMISRAQAIAKLEDPAEKGYFREHFIYEVIGEMLPIHIGAGSGTIIGRAQGGEDEIQSGQCDVIIFDKRTLFPFIANTKASIFPVESVIAIIEVKSRIDSRELGRIQTNMDKLKALIDQYESEFEYYDEEGKRLTVKRQYNDILFLLFSYNMRGDGSFGIDLEDLRTKKEGKDLLPEYMKGYCILRACSNFHMKKENNESEWVFSQNIDHLYEIKRFLSISIDNIMRIAENRYQKVMFAESSKVLQNDLVGGYIRD